MKKSLKCLPKVLSHSSLMGSASMAMAVCLLAFNISACIYVRGLIKSFHRDAGCLPKWAKLAREAIEKLDGAKKQFFVDDVFEDTIECALEKTFFSSPLFQREDVLRLKVTDKGFDMRDEMEIRKEARRRNNHNDQPPQTDNNGSKDDDVNEIVEMALDNAKADTGDDLYSSVSTLKQRFEEYIKAVEKKKQEEEANEEQKEGKGDQPKK